MVWGCGETVRAKGTVTTIILLVKLEGKRSQGRPARQSVVGRCIEIDRAELE